MGDFKYILVEYFCFPISFSLIFHSIILLTIVELNLKLRKCHFYVEFCTFLKPFLHFFLYI